jgi:4-amino-4-deoxy-L-arabinose transferase-like glycosyltransferase
MPLRLWLLAAGLTALLVGFSQTLAFYPDEGFHLVAARLVNDGKQPYLDFFYPHAPLWVYLMAAWMWIFGDTWRSVHVLSALLTGACTAVVARYVFSRYPESSWRVATAASAALLMGLSALVIWYGTVAVAYGLSLLLIFVAFWLVADAGPRFHWYQPFLAGLCAGTAAACLLLTAPVPLILLFWLLRHTDRERRFRVGAYFITGALIPFVPLVWLAVQGPRQAVFNMLEFHLFYRATWSDRSAIFRISLRTLASLLSSLQAWLLILLSVIALTVFTGGHQDQRLRRDLSLCAWVAVGLALFLTTPVPTFTQYFILVIPFLSVLASRGIQVLASRLWPSARPFHVLLPIILLFVLGLAQPVYQLRPETWRVIEDLGREVARVTPENGLIYAPDLVVFAAKRVPLAGMANIHGMMLRLPPERLASLHITPESQVERWLSEGRFHTVVVSTRDPRIQRYGLLERYSQQRQVHEAYVLSDPRR